MSREGFVSNGANPGSAGLVQLRVSRAFRTTPFWSSWHLLGCFRSILSRFQWTTRPLQYQFAVPGAICARCPRLHFLTPAVRSIGRDARIAGIPDYHRWIAFTSPPMYKGSLPEIWCWRGKSLGKSLISVMWTFYSRGMNLCSFRGHTLPTDIGGSKVSIACAQVTG